MPLGSAIVLGVGPGIGAAVAKKWAAEGYKVACVCRNAEKAERIATEVGRGAVGFSCDVTDEAALKSTLAKIETALGPADFLCYNAGSGCFKKPFEITAAEFELGWRSNCAGLLIAAQAIGPGMVARGAGTIAVTGATASMRGKPFTTGFASAKMAQRGLAQSLARDMGPKGVHVFLAIIDGGVGDGEQKIAPSDIAQTYWDVAKQGKSCWTHEIDVRPFNENW